MEFKICNDINHWDDFVLSSAQGNIFCKSSFLESIPDKYELPVIIEDGKIILGAVVIKDETGIVNAPYPFTMYQGIILSHEYNTLQYHKRSSWLSDKLKFFLNEMEKKYNKISFCLSHKFDDLREIQWYNYHEPNLGLFKIDLRYTGILDIRNVPDFENYLMSVRSVRRQEYRRAIKDGYTVERSNDVNLLNKLHGMTFERQGITRSKKEEFFLLKLAENALNKSIGELLICKDKNGVPASASLFMYDANYGYYHFGASDPEYRKSGAGTLLIMENIKVCMEKGLIGVDFMGVNSPNRGDFKMSFNAKTVPYYNVSYDNPNQEIISI